MRKNKGKGGKCFIKLNIFYLKVIRWLFILRLSSFMRRVFFFKND